MCLDKKRERFWLMVGTHVSPKRTRNRLQGTPKRRTRNGNYSFRLTSSTGARKEFTLQTRNYDEAVRNASELDSIWLAPTREVARALMNAVRGFSEQVKKISFEEAWVLRATAPARIHTTDYAAGSFPVICTVERSFPSGGGNVVLRRLNK